MSLFASNTRRGALAVLAGSALTAPLLAQPRPATPALPARVRLLGGMPVEGGRLLVGVRVDLDRGWKTYWRTPGDSGIAPRFDWSRSTNLRAARVLYPAPERLHDGTGDLLGYEREVVFPVHVTPSDPNRSVELVLQFDFGVCERICIPASVTTQATVGRASPPAAETQAIQTFLARVPRSVPPRTTLTDWAFDPAVMRLRFLAQMRGGVRHAVVEGPSEWRLPLPDIERLPDGSIRGRLTVTRVPAAALRLAPVIVTIVGNAEFTEETRSLE